MNWLLPAVIMTIASSIILTLIYFYLHYIDRERFLKLWALAWLVYSVRSLFQLGLISLGDNAVLMIGNQGAALISTLLLMWGTYQFLGRTLSRWWIYSGVVCGIWMLSAIALDVPFLWLTLPTFLLQAIAYVWTGVYLLRSEKLVGMGKQAAGWAFILWGIHKADFPLLRPVEWFAPWGYMIAALLGLVVAMSILLVYFEKTRTLLRTSKQYLQSILQAANSGIIVLNDQQQIILFNEAAEEIFGYTAEEVLGQLNDILLPERFQDAHRQQMKQFAAQAKTGRFMHVMQGVDLTGRQKSGTEFPAEIAISMFVSDAKPFFVAVVNDITERKRAEQTLRDSEARLSAFANAMPDLGFILDGEGRYLEVLGALEELLATDNITLKGQLLHDLLPPDSADSCLNAIQSSLRTGELQDVIYDLNVPGGHRWFEARIMPMSPKTDAFAKDAVVLLARDITERIQAEQQRERYAERLEALHRIDQAVLAAEQPRNIAQSALQYLVPLVACHRASVTLFDMGHQRYEILAVQTDSKTELGSDTVKSMENIWQKPEVRRQTELVQVDNIDDFETLTRADQILKAEGIRSYVSVPLSVDGNVIGTLNLGSRTVGDFTEGQIEIAKQVADSLAVAIHQAQTLEAEREQRMMTEALRKTASAISSSLNLDEVLDQILLNLGQVVPYDAADVMLLNPDKSISRIVRSQGYEQFTPHDDFLTWEFDVAHTVNLRRMLRSQQPVIIPDTRNEDTWMEIAGTAWIRSSAGTPIIHEGKVLGFLTINSSQPEFFTPEHIGRLSAFADQVAIALQNARLYEELESHSEFLEQAVKKRTAELRRAKERVETILNHSPDAILLLTANEEIDTANPAFQRMFGYEIQDVYLQSPTILAAPDHAARLGQTLHSFEQQVDPQRIELVAQRKDGSTFDAQVMVAAVREDENLLGIVCSLRDITTLKNVGRIKDEFISTATHELRTPLTSIQGFSEILLTRELESERQKRYLKMINEQATQLAKIIDELLDISRLESGQGLTLEPESVQLGELVAEVIEPFVDTASQHHFELDGLLDVPPVLADPFRLAQVLRNLVSNAVKYSPEGGHIIIRGQIENDKMAINIADEGIGMTSEQQSHLFEKFYRANISSTPGTGLGLVISKLIVEGHGGEIQATSVPGEGSTFTFTVPVMEDEGTSKE